MAFTVEDGTGVDDANSLCSLEFADAYFTDRAITAWTGSDEDKQSALIRATDYIEYRFSQRWIGDLAETDQSLSWPRTDAEYDDQVPVLVRKACAEYAKRALTGELAPDPEATESGRIQVIGESHKVGPIQDSYRYASSVTVSSNFRPYPAADALLTPLLKNTRGVIR